MAHITGGFNQQLDAQSSTLLDNKRKLNPKLFKRIVRDFSQPHNDLFASKAIIVVSDWPTQHRYPNLFWMSQGKALTFLPSSTNVMHPPKPSEKDPLQKIQGK